MSTVFSLSISMSEVCRATNRFESLNTCKSEFKTFDARLGQSLQSLTLSLSVSLLLAPRRGPLSTRLFGSPVRATSPAESLTKNHFDTVISSGQASARNNNAMSDLLIHNLNALLEGSETTP